jgi:hypothetical protein
MSIILDGTTGITTPDITSAAGIDSADLTGDIAAARITDALNATGSAPIYACRAWVNFDGTGTVAIRASGNVSSITDNGTGNYSVNFITAMPDESYSIVSNSGLATANGSNRYSVASIDTVSSAFVSSEIASTNARVDNDLITVHVFR